jgi:hypothetical protein
MILGQLNPFKNRGVIGRPANHVAHFSTALVRQIGIVLSQGRHGLISATSIGNYPLVVNR